MNQKFLLRESRVLLPVQDMTGNRLVCVPIVLASTTVEPPVDSTLLRLEIWKCSACHEAKGIIHSSRPRSWSVGCLSDFLLPGDPITFAPTTNTKSCRFLHLPFTTINRDAELPSLLATNNSKSSPVNLFTNLIISRNRGYDYDLLEGFIGQSEGCSCCRCRNDDQLGIRLHAGETAPAACWQENERAKVFTPCASILTEGEVEVTDALS